MTEFCKVSSPILRVFLAAMLLLPLTVFAQVDMLTHHNDNQRTGANLSETILTPATVNPQNFGMRFKHAVDDQVYTQPLIATDIKIAGGWHDLVIVTTVNNSVYAFDANDASAAAPFWHVNFGTPADLNDMDFGCVDINGNMGIIGTPVINANKDTLYVVALTKSGGKFNQRLHALDLSTGADLAHSPVEISAPGFDPLMQNQRPGLFLAGANVYIAYASHCDKAPYHGYLIGYDATSLSQVGSFNASPNGNGASIWQSGQPPAVDEKGIIYLATGNGSWDGVTQFSESFIKLDQSLHLIDWFTPTNHFQLDRDDNDLDSSGATLIPGTQLVLGGGKEGVLYLVDRDHLGHLGDEHALQHFKATGSHLHSLVYWKSAIKGPMLYLWGQTDKLRVYKFNGTRLEETPDMTGSQKNEGHPGAMLSLSANGQHDGILWAAIHASGDSWHESRPGILHAYDADNITHELWNSLQNPSRDDCNNYAKMAPPTVTNGKVYLASFGKTNVGSGQLCVYGLLSSAPAPAPPAGVHASLEGRFVIIQWSAGPKAETYTLVRTRANETQVVASGLTRPAFTEPATETGPTDYQVIAVSANGQSALSAPARVTPNQVPVPRMAH